MARSSAHRTLLQNLFFGGKDELAGAFSTKDNNISAVSFALTFTAALPIVFALSFIAQYLEDDF